MIRSNQSLAFNLLLLVVGMVLLTYASVPLYRAFCQITGFGGTTKVAENTPENVTDRFMTVRFNADVAPKLPWNFSPEITSIRVRVGEEKLIAYIAENQTNEPVTGHAVYNVVPHKAGPYFAKIACFCFEDQTLQPKQKVHMPVSFFIDPALLDDPDMKDVDSITLSYTFFHKAGY